MLPESRNTRSVEDVLLLAARKKFDDSGVVGYMDLIWRELGRRGQKASVCVEIFAPWVVATLEWKNARSGDREDRRSVAFAINHEGEQRIELTREDYSMDINFAIGTYFEYFVGYLKAVGRSWNDVTHLERIGFGVYLVENLRVLGLRRAAAEFLRQ